MQLLRLGLNDLGKDYYRYAGQKERGTCDNRVSVRKEPLETETLAIL